MDRVINSALMRPRTWTAVQLLRFSVLTWFVENGVSIKQINELYAKEIPENWETNNHFDLRINNKCLNFSFTVEEGRI